MMKKLLFAAFAAFQTMIAVAQVATVSSPDGRLKVNVDMKDGRPVYAVLYDGKQMLDESPLGFVANVGDYSQQLTFASADESKINKDYTLNRSKVSKVHYEANQLSARRASRRSR